MNPEIQKLLLNLNTELQLTSQEIADILWLTSHRLENLGITPPTEIIKPSEESPETEILSPVITPQKPSINKEQATAKIYPKIKPIKREIRSEEEVIPLSIPDAPSLREPLGLLKQLRPLMHRVPSATEEILDEEATVNKIAEERFFLPVMQPVLEPWLELALVVDEQNSMLIWRHTIVELKHLLENYGIFRHVSTLSMVAEAEGKLTLRNNIGINTQERDSITPKELIDPSGSRLILIVSDCVDKIWRNGEVLSFLKEWTQTSPVAILQMLPERMWQRTALSLGSMVLFKALSAGVSNRDLIITKQLLWDDIEFSTAIKIPVFSLETEILSKWAKMIAAKGQTEAVGFIFSPELEDTSDLEETLPDPVQDAQERVNRFYLASSPLGVKLAMLLAAAPVIILPVVRIIQERMLPESSQIQVAEVFLGGLLKPLTAIERFTNPDEVQYDFMSEEIRIILLKNAPKSQAIRVFNKVSEYVAAQLGKSVKKFAAQLQNPYQQQEVKSFAEVSEGILRNLGGEYAQFAEKIELASQDNRQLLGEINQIQILTTYTEEPWSLPLDVLVLSTNNSASIGGGRLTESFLEFIGEDNGKILGKARIDVFRTLHKKCITPDSPLPISLSTSIKDLLNISDTSQPCFLFYATVENPKPTVENAVLATEAIIKLMVQYQLKQVVLPLIGTGNNGLAKEEVAVAMITKIREVCSDLPPQSIESM
jgi:hypothetical protein